MRVSDNVREHLEEKRKNCVRVSISRIPVEKFIFLYKGTWISVQAVEGEVQSYWFVGEEDVRKLLDEEEWELTNASSVDVPIDTGKFQEVQLKEESRDY